MRIALCALFLAAAAHADEWNKQWTVPAAAELRVDLGDGSIHVHAGAGNRIEARLRTEGFRISPAEVTVSEHLTGNRVNLEIRVPKNRHFDMGSHSVTLELSVPAGILAEIHTGDGSVHLDGVHGTLTLSTGDGAIEALDIEGSLIARTGDGHIKIRGRLDTLDLNTGDGGLDADILDGSCMKTSWRAHTGDGHVTLRLPSSFKATIDAHTSDGGVNVDLPIALESTQNGKDTLRGKLNGGGELINLRSGDGSIRIGHI